MSLEPTRPNAPAIEGMREAARAQTRRLSAGLVYLFAIGLAVFLVLVLTVLDYRFQQDAHRLWKILFGVAFITAIFMLPRFGIGVFPIATPYLAWLPKVPVPALNPLNIMLFGVFGAWAAPRVAARKPIFRRGHLSPILSWLFVVAALSIVRGAVFPTGYHYPAAAATLDFLRSALTFLVYFIGLAMVSGVGDRRRLAWAIVIGLAAESMTTIQYGQTGSGGRAVGSIGQANELGAFLCLYTVLALSMFFATKNWFAKLILLGATLLGVIAEILTVSRAGFLGMAGGLFFVCLRSSRWMTIVMLGVALSAPFWIPDDLRSRLEGTTTESDGDELSLEPSAQIRVYTWQALMKVITDHPLDGVGFAGLHSVLPSTGEDLGLDVMDSSHNSYLRFLAEMGILGLVLFVLLMWNCWTLAMKGLRLAKTKFDRQLALGLAAATLTLAWSCAFGDRVFSILVMGSFWMMCALVDDMVQEAEGHPGLNDDPAPRAGAA
jgi:O-antigen ligase